ncbi:MAG: hypothetical protein NTZ79_02755 [Proteobacteria bacterium]|nr:hypothetical protein [Pseudomonadota bacterium]
MPSFLTLQYLYGLARAGRAEADELLDAIGRHANEAPAAVRGVWADIARPAAYGLVAHARGDYVTCRAQLRPALGRLLEIGGSHAQRDLFQQIYLDSLVHSGACTAAQQLLEELPAQAAAAAARADRPRR